MVQTEMQTEAVQAFLLNTAVLSQFNAELCPVMTGKDCRKLLRQGEGANLFLNPLDAERNWHHYHHLFADQMIVSIHTVKVHTRCLCDKLDVNNRSPAVARGRAYRLPEAQWRYVAYPDRLTQYIPACTHSGDRVKRRSRSIVVSSEEST